MMYEGKEWETEPVMIRDHASCYPSRPIPIPGEDMTHEQWLTDAVNRILQEATAAQVAGIGRGDWADTACHLSIVYNGVLATMTNILENYLPPLDALRLRGKMIMLAHGTPSTILSRVCDNPECQGEPNGHIQYALLVGDGSDAESNYFPPEWMIDGTPE